MKARLHYRSDEPARVFTPLSRDDVAHRLTRSNGGAGGLRSITECEYSSRQHGRQDRGAVMRVKRRTTSRRSRITHATPTDADRVHVEPAATVIVRSSAQMTQAVRGGRQSDVAAPPSWRFRTGTTAISAGSRLSPFIGSESLESPALRQCHFRSGQVCQHGSARRETAHCLPTGEVTGRQSQPERRSAEWSRFSIRGHPHRIHCRCHP